eukprot:jgi/Botrbrau1/4799/Bobra.0325s0021.1
MLGEPLPGRSDKVTQEGQRTDRAPSICPSAGATEAVEHQDLQSEGVRISLAPPERTAGQAPVATSESNRVGEKRMHEEMSSGGGSGPFFDVMRAVVPLKDNTGCLQLDCAASRNRYRFPGGSENQPIASQHTDRIVLDDQHAGAGQILPNASSEQGFHQVVSAADRSTMMNKTSDGWNGYVSLMRNFLPQ